MPPLYAVRDLHRSFGEREVLNIPSLVFEKNRVYGLLGPNGSGKTTLMRLLAFLDSPSSGVISFMGTEAAPERNARFRSQVVWVPQSPVMFAGSLQYNVEYPLRLKGRPRAERRDKALSLLRDVGLEHLASAPAPRLSGGEAQRGSIARALAAGAEVILFDEPTASVDSRSRDEITRLIGRLHRDFGLSILVTTHDRELAEAVCMEKVYLRDGRLVSEKTPDQSDVSQEFFPEKKTVCGFLRLDEKEGFLVGETTASPVKGADVRKERVVLHGLLDKGESVVLLLRDGDSREWQASITDEKGLALAKTLRLGNTGEVIFR